MTAYSNLSVDLPSRIRDLDPAFRKHAELNDLQVTYLFMKLASSFLLPYERIAGTSGASADDICDQQAIRPSLEFDRRFRESGYCKDFTKWKMIDTDDYSAGPEYWKNDTQPLELTAAKVLKIIRHSIAHSNLYFGGQETIQHIYFGNRRSNSPQSDEYRIIRATVAESEYLCERWIENVVNLKAHPALLFEALAVA